MTFDTFQILKPHAAVLLQSAIEEADERSKDVEGRTPEKVAILGLCYAIESLGRISDTDPAILLLHIANYIKTVVKPPNIPSSATPPPGGVEHIEPPEG